MNLSDPGQADRRDANLLLIDVHEGPGAEHVARLGSAGGGAVAVGLAAEIVRGACVRHAFESRRTIMGAFARGVAKLFTRKHAHGADTAVELSTRAILRENVAGQGLSRG